LKVDLLQNWRKDPHPPAPSPKKGEGEPENYKFKVPLPTWERDFGWGAWVLQEV
jgi:hypothetical protein